jgi:hypothetical protein
MPWENHHRTPPCVERQGGTEGRKYFVVGLLTFVDVPGGALWLFDTEGDQVFLAFVGGLVIAPIAAAVGVFLTALITHLLVVLMVGSGHSGLGATFRVVSYSSVTGLAPRDAAPRSGRRRQWGPRRAALPAAPCRVGLWPNSCGSPRVAPWR